MTNANQAKKLFKINGEECELIEAKSVFGGHYYCTFSNGHQGNYSQDVISSWGDTPKLNCNGVLIERLF